MYRTPGLRTLYVAASFEQVDHVRDLRARLSDYVDITSTWCDEPPMVNNDPRNEPREMRTRGNEDYLDIQRSDMVAILTDVPSTSGGFHTELGIALALDKRLLLVGPRLNVFHFMNKIEHYANVDALVARLIYEYDEGYA